MLTYIVKVIWKYFSVDMTYYKKENKLINNQPSQSPPSIITIS